MKENNKFEVLKPLCKKKEEYNDLTLKLSLVGVIISQVNEAFIRSLYTDKASALISSAEKSIETMQTSFIESYVKNSLEVSQLMPIPDIEKITEWVEEVHLNIAAQLYNDDFVETVFLPALNSITSAIIEFSKEENEKFEAQDG